MSNHVRPQNRSTHFIRTTLSASVDEATQEVFRPKARRYFFCAWKLNPMSFQATPSWTYFCSNVTWMGWVG